MEVYFSPEQEAQLSQIAAQAGTDTERLVKEAALRLVVRVRASGRPSAKGSSKRIGASCWKMMKCVGG